MCCFSWSGENLGRGLITNDYTFHQTRFMASGVGTAAHSAFRRFLSSATTTGGAAPSSSSKARKKKNLVEVLQFLPNWGLGAKVTKKHWQPQTYYQLTKIQLGKDARHGSAWGIYHEAGTPKSGSEEKIGAFCRIRVACGSIIWNLRFVGVSRKVDAECTRGRMALNSCSRRGGPDISCGRRKQPSKSARHYREDNQESWFIHWQNVATVAGKSRTLSKRFSSQVFV
ncbi:hypothetical protein R1flu_018671 [Riccia fluitans]|uniref:Uncharacterized protein n=1 Tax=Riccia fluitans TaxID=41844 RepID=A0ABD1ZGI5_9MARC